MSAPKLPSSSVAGPVRPGAVQIALLALALVLGWRGVLAITGWRADFAECSYQQNLLRLETYRERIRGERGSAPPVVLAGTSITGRLLPEYFAGTPLAGVANLGLDGASPGFSLEAILRETHVPTKVLLETYLLHKEAGGNERLIAKSLASPGARLADADRLLRTESRPSALLYSALKRRRESLEPGRVSAPTNSPFGINPPAEGSQERLTRLIRALQARGCEVVLADIPIGRDWPPGPNLGEPVASRLSAALGLRRVDCRAVLRAQRNEPHFTADGLHLDAHSAREVARVLSELVRVLPPQPNSSAP